MDAEHESQPMQELHRRSSLLLLAQETRQLSLKLCKQALIAREEAREAVQLSRLWRQIMEEYTQLRQP